MPSLVWAMAVDQQLAEGAIPKHGAIRAQALSQDFLPVGDKQQRRIL